MSVRLVTGKIERTDGMPWQNTRVQFRRSKGTFTSQAQYPPDIIEAQTDQSGNIFSIQNSIVLQGVYLWCNAEGHIPTSYDCILPGDTFTFSLPVGNLPVNLSTLRAGNISSTAPQNTTILEYIDTSIENAVLGIQLGSTQIYSNPFTTTINLSALRVVNLATGTYADNLNVNDLTGIFGITINASTQGTTNKALVFGELFDNSFNFNPGNIYLGNNGNLIQILTGAEKFILCLGVSVNNNKMFVNAGDLIQCT